MTPWNAGLPVVWPEQRQKQLLKPLATYQNAIPLQYPSGVLRYVFDSAAVVGEYQG
jgi:hypothetical protein